MRGFVIGNGPSLSFHKEVGDLDLLANELTAVCNRFDLLETAWNPTLWVLADVHHEDPWWDWDTLLGRDGVEYYFRRCDEKRLHRYNQTGIHYVDRCPHIGSWPPGEHTPTEWHLPTLCEYGGSIGYALQLAVLRGWNPIYLLGCDLYQYRGPDDPDINHFDPDYCPYKIRKSTGQEVNGPAEWERLNNRLIHSHQIALQSAKAEGVDIFYAGEGGSLEVYPRVEFSSLFT